MLWHISGGDISEFVHADDQFQAWDTLRDRSAYDFGLIMKAEPNENDDPFLVRTSMLMRRWGRIDDAKKFVSRGMECGMPDTAMEDIAATERR